MYNRLATEEDLYKLISHTVYKSFVGTSILIRKLDESMEFDDIVQEVFTYLYEKSKTRCIYVFQIRSLTGGYMSNMVEKLKRRNNVLKKENRDNIGGDNFNGESIFSIHGKQRQDNRPINTIDAEEM